MSDAESLRIFAPAKINLTLHVTGRRADGYHDLDSLVAFADVGDDITITLENDFSFIVDGPFAAALSDVPAEKNLAVRAARAMAVRFERPLDIALRLTKNLPAAAGLGGGSADAAAVVRGLCRMWAVPLTDVPEILIALGSDVPACAAVQPVWMRGRGEHIDPAPALPEAVLVLVNPGVACPTPAVFAGLNGRFSTPPAQPKNFATFDALISFLQCGDNDLALPASIVAPVIGELLAMLAACDDCALARLSGSGATGFGLFATAEAGQRAAQSIALARPDWWVRAASFYQETVTFLK